MRLDEFFAIVNHEMKLAVKKELEDLIGRKISFKGMKDCGIKDPNYHKWVSYTITVKSIKPSVGNGTYKIPLEIEVKSVDGDTYTIPNNADLQIHYEKFYAE